MSDTLTVSNINYKTLVGQTGSALTVSSLSLTSTTISLGQSTNQTYTNFSNGSITTGWASTLTGTTAIKKVVLGSNGATQTVLQSSGSTMSTVITSVNSGQTWTGSTMKGLPTSGTLAYQTYSSTAPTITAMNAAASSGNQLAIASNNTVYASADSGATFAPQGLGQNANPFIYLPFDGSVADVMGNATYASGSSTTPVYTTTLNKVGTQALSLVNTASQSGNATNYQRWNWTGSANFTVSFWFNATTPAVTNAYQYIFTAYSGYVVVYLTPGGGLYLTIPSGGSYVTAAGGTGIATLIAANTWYNVVATFQTGGVCSLYLNNSLIGSYTNVGGVGSYTTSFFALGTFDNSITAPFNGYIDDFRLYNYAVTNPSGAALINPLVGPIMPYVYVTFDGSTTTDVMGNSTVTATGSPGFVAGLVGSNAINFANAGTGSNPTQYITAPISGLGGPITFSCWFQALILPTSVQSIVWTMNAVTTGAAVVQFNINTAGTVGFQIYNGSSWQGVYSASAISLNTWYNAVCIYQAGSTCSLYLNGALTTITMSGSVSPAIASYTLGGANVSPATPTYGFKGYVDDFRIYNGAFTPSQLNPVLSSPSFSTGSPNIYLPFENGSVLDVMGYSAISARGTMNFVPGVVGTSALNLVNPAGGTAVNYVRGSWAGSANFTVSFWFNMQTTATTNSQILFSAYNSSLGCSIGTNNAMYFYFPNGGSTNQTTITSAAALNTWYNVIIIFQTGGLCSVYLNNSLAGSFTNSGGYGTFGNVGVFGLGVADSSASNAFNGYIDDFKLYNSAIPFSALGPMNYTQAAISNTGAYQVVAAANGGVYLNGSQVTAPVPVAAVNTVGGQVITPALAGLTTASWTQNGVVWTASSSTNNGGPNFLAQYAFNTLATSSVSPYSWASNGTYTAGVYTGAVSTSILGGVGTVNGEWIQLQSSVPLVMYSYSYGCGASTNIPKLYYIVGSNDGTNWYPIQMATMTTNPLNTNFTACSSYLLVNQSGTQTISGGTTGSGTFTTYSSTTNAYTYFRVVINSTFTGANAEYTELFINFTTPATPLYVAPTTALLANLTTINVMPQQTGLTSSTWTTNGISWVASNSSQLAGAYYVYYLFDANVSVSSRWIPSSQTYTTSGNTSGITTTISGIGSVTGDWVQLQASVPLIMSSYQLATGAIITRMPKTYYIIGSNDGSTWYPIQYASGGAITNTATNSLVPNVILVNNASAQPFGSSSVTTTTYATTTNAYLYFRLVTLSNYGSSADFIDIGEWFVNFTAYTPSLVQALTVSPTGQYMTVTGAGAVAPQLTGLAASTWTANGVNWTASQSSALSANYAAFALFNNYYGSTQPYSWASAVGIYNAGSPYTYGASTSTTIQGIGAVLGEWAQIQSSIPLVMASYAVGAGGGTTNFPSKYYIVGSTDNATWYPIQYAIVTTNPFAQYSTSSTYLTVNQSGVQTIIGSAVGSITCTTYNTTANAYTYFRLVATNSSGGTLVEIGEWYINFQSGPSYYSTNYGSTWTTALSAATLPNANLLATSGNGQYSLQGYGQTVLLVNNYSTGYSTGSYTTPTFTPALSASVGAVNCASISATGQYMSILIQSTTYNVYYSTNYGVSFTGLTVGAAAMMSCAMSADGSYLTVASATQVYTLNLNTKGYAVTLGNQAGVVNQGQNAIAIGNQAGVTNQSAGSIVLNGSGSALNAYLPGLFVAPIATAGSSVSSSFSILGYGSDSQVVQSSSLFLGANGYVGISTTSPNAPLQFANTIANRKIVMWETSNNDHQYYGFGINNNILRYQVDTAGSNHVFYAGTSSTTSNELMRISGNGNVGIGTAAPGEQLSLYLNTNTGYVGLSLTNPNAGSSSQTALKIKSDVAQSAYLFLNASTNSSDGPASAFTIRNDAGALRLQGLGGYANALGVTIAATTGNVGIGITNPAEILHTYRDPSNVIRLQTSSTDNGYIGAGYDNLSLSSNYSSTGARTNTGRGSSQIMIYSPIGGGFITFNTSPSINTAVQERMRIDSNGYVGIGIASPTYPLHVSPTVGWGGAAGYYFNLASGSFGNIPAQANWGVSIYGSVGIVAGNFVAAASDARIKKNIKSVTNARSILDRLEIVSYDRIDQNYKGSDMGIIAQNVKEALPRAINIQTQFIPNIYARATHAILPNQNVIIYVPCIHENITTGVTVRLMIVKGNKEETYEAPLINWTGSSFEVTPWEDYSADHHVFAYGTEVNDFLAVEKDQIGILAAACVKEWNPIITSQAAQIATLEATLAATTTQLATLEARLAAAGI